jgi:hypothetical protein
VVIRAVKVMGDRLGNGVVPIAFVRSEAMCPHVESFCQVSYTRLHSRSRIYLRSRLQSRSRSQSRARSWLRSRVWVKAWSQSSPH